MKTWWWTSNVLTALYRFNYLLDSRPFLVSRAFRWVLGTELATIVVALLSH